MFSIQWKSNSPFKIGELLTKAINVLTVFGSYKIGDNNLPEAPSKFRFGYRLFEKKDGFQRYTFSNCELTPTICINEKKKEEFWLPGRISNKDENSSYDLYDSYSLNKKYRNDFFYRAVGNECQPNRKVQNISVTEIFGDRNREILSIQFAWEFIYYCLLEWKSKKGQEAVGYINGIPAFKRFMKPPLTRQIKVEVEVNKENNSVRYLTNNPTIVAKGDCISVVPVTFIYTTDKHIKSTFIKPDRRGWNTYDIVQQGDKNE